MKKNLKNYNIKKKVFIIIPKINNDGPIKGAIALSNSLFEKKYDVTLITINGKLSKHDHLNNNIDVINLEEMSSIFILKILKFRKILNNFRKNYNNIFCVSYCLSADILNSFSTNNVIKISSMRARIFQNYFFSFGLFGYFLAYFHFLFLRRFHTIIAMNKSMAKEISKYYNGKIVIINNFIDEKFLKKYKKKKLLVNKNKSYKKIIYVGSLTRRKNPILLVETIQGLIKKNYKIKLSILGNGPLYQVLHDFIKNKNLCSSVKMYGFIKNPYRLMSQHDILILPSYSEGFSRSVLEGLFFGLVCFFRNSEDYKKILKKNKNCYIYDNDTHLSDLLESYLQNKHKYQNKNNMLPNDFKQDACVNKHLVLLN